MGLGKLWRRIRERWNEAVERRAKQKACKHDWHFVGRSWKMPGVPPPEDETPSPGSYRECPLCGQRETFRTVF